MSASLVAGDLDAVAKSCDEAIVRVIVLQTTISRRYSSIIGLELFQKNPCFGFCDDFSAAAPKGKKHKHDDDSFDTAKSGKFKWRKYP